MAEYFYGEHQLTRKYLGPKWVAKIRKIKASCSKAFFRIFGTTVVGTVPLKLDSKHIIENLTHTSDIIKRDFDLAIGEEASEEELLEILTLRVTEMLEGDVDLLMSYLYRLDIEAHKISAVLQMSHAVPPNVGLARLILDRQKQRIKTKQSIEVKPIEGWEF